MSKVASLLCDFVVPVVGGSVFEALSVMATLCKQMKENEAVCRRVYERLRFVWDELQKCTSAASLRDNRVLVLYGAAIARFLKFLETHSRKRLLRRLMESSHVAECVRNFHEEIDELFKLLSIVHMAEMSAWHQEWERDRSFQRNMLKEVLSGACCEHSGASPTSTVDTLTCSTCSCSSTDDDTVIERARRESKQSKTDYLDTEQRLVVREKELEQTIRDHVEEYGYDVSGVLDLLRTLPSTHLALQGAVVLHELEMELQPEVLCLALTYFILELINTSAAKQDAGFPIVRQRAEEYWFTWFPDHVRALVEDQGVLLESAGNHELLQVAGNESKIDSTWRRIVSSTSESKRSSDELEIRWRLVPEDDNKTLFRVVNFRYPYEWLYATIMQCKDVKGASYALSTQPALVHGSTQTVPEALWELQTIPLSNGSANGAFMLFNPHTGSYLCTSTALLDRQRRFALIVPKGKRGLPSQQLAWYLRTCEHQAETSVENDLKAQHEPVRHTPKAALEIAALELVIRDRFETSGRDISTVVDFLRKLPEAKHVLFGCSIARALDLEVSKNATSRRDSLVLPFFVYELATTLPTKSRQLAQQYWLHWFSPVVKAVVLGQGVVLEDTTSDSSRYLIANDSNEGVCEDERPVLSCSRRQKLSTGHANNSIPNADDLETQWKFEPGDDTFTTFYMVNVRYPSEDVLVAGNVDQGGGREFTNCVVTCYSGHRRSTLRSPTQPRMDVGKQGAAAVWVLCDTGEDCFKVYHHEKRSYLSSAKEQLGKDRCLVRLCNEGMATNWRFQSLLGLA